MLIRVVFSWVWTVEQCVQEKRWSRRVRKIIDPHDEKQNLECCMGKRKGGMIMDENFSRIMEFGVQKRKTENTEVDGESLGVTGESMVAGPTSWAFTEL